MKLKRPVNRDGQNSIDKRLSEIDKRLTAIYEILSDLQDDPFEKLYQVEKEQKLDLARKALQGEELKCTDVNGNKFSLKVSDWLRWVQSDDPGALAWWHWIHQNKPEGETNNPNEPSIKNRDEYVMALWHTINDENGKNLTVKEEIVEKLTHWSYYQNHFFNWFLNRFDIVRAREVFSHNPFSRFVHIFLSVPILLLLFLYFGNQLFSWCWIGALIAILLFLCSFTLRYENIEYYFQSLMPRLAVTIGMGYLFILSTDKLVTLINSDVLPWYEKEIIGFALIIGVGIYMLIAIHRRGQPPMDWMKLVRRTGDIMLLGLTYSAIGLWITEPILLEIQKKEPGAQNLTFTYDALFLLAAVALAIGVLLQLVWEERPVTQPL